MFRLKSNCVRMYTVHCPVIVDNTCAFQHSPSHDHCTYQFRPLSVSLSVSHIRRWIDPTDVPSSCGGVWDPWSVEYNPETLQCCCSTEAETGFVSTSAQSFDGRPFLILRSPSCTRSCTQKLSCINVFRSGAC